MDVELHGSLDGQVALVTGATRGIGARIASELVGLGATVYAGARNIDDIEATEQHAVEFDVTSEEDIAAATERIDREAGRLDVLVNNAGIGGPSEPLDEAATPGIDATLDTNLRGPMLVTKHALSLLLDRAGGRVVNLSRGMGALGEGMSGGSPAYRVSKAGLNGLTTYLHGEYGNRGLLANAVCPGWVRTDMGGPSAARSVAEGADTPVWCCRFAPGSPSGTFWRNRAVIEW